MDRALARRNFRGFPAGNPLLMTPASSASIAAAALMALVAGANRSAKG